MEQNLRDGQLGGPPPLATGLLYPILIVTGESMESLRYIGIFTADNINLPVST